MQALNVTKRVVSQPDFGAEGALDRFGQIEPKVLFACDGYYYAGKVIDIRDKVIKAQRERERKTQRPKPAPSSPAPK